MGGNQGSLCDQQSSYVGLKAQMTTSVQVNRSQRDLGSRSDVAETLVARIDLMLETNLII